MRKNYFKWKKTPSHFDDNYFVQCTHSPNNSQYSSNLNASSMHSDIYRVHNLSIFVHRPFGAIMRMINRLIYHHWINEFVRIGEGIIMLCCHHFCYCFILGAGFTSDISQCPDKCSTNYVRYSIVSEHYRLAIMSLARMICTNNQMESGLLSDCDKPIFKHIGYIKDFMLKTSYSEKTLSLIYNLMNLN